MAGIVYLVYVFLVFGAGVAAFSTPELQLIDGNKIPVLGLGTAVHGQPEESGLFSAVNVAIDAGYRLIDTARAYRDEHIIGEALSEKFKEGKLKRDDIFITTKLWNDDHRRVEAALKESLRKLQLDYVDLYLIHWPIAYFENGTTDNVDFVDTWRAMEEVREKGLARSIGVSNFNERQLTRLLQNSKVKPAVLQIEVNPNLTQLKLVKFAQDNGMVVMAYSPFGSLPSSKRNKDSPAPRWNDPILTAIGKKYGKSTAQVVLRYLIERSLVAIPKSVKASNIRENINIFDFQLTPEEVRQIGNFNLDRRTVYSEQWKSHPEFPFEK